MSGGAWIGTVIASTLVTLIAMMAMGIGVAFGRRQPAGTCRSGGAAGCVCDPHKRTCELREETT